VNILVTGATGFVGSHLVDALLASGVTPIHCFVRWHSTGERPNLAHINPSHLDIHYGDLTDPWSTRKIIQSVHPDQLYHVASHTHVPYSYGAPTATLDTNAQGTINLLEAVRTYAKDCKILVVSSGEVYGHHDDIITEHSALNVRSPYGLGKLAEDRAAYMYQQAYGLNLVIARSFSQTGPRKFVGLVDSFWSWQIARMETQGIPPVLAHGLLTPIRTFCDVRDMVQAYLTYMAHGRAGDVYNICGNDVLSMSDILQQLQNMTSIKFALFKDPRLLRPTDVMMLRPSCEPFMQRFGWKPVTPYATSLKNLLNYWRSRLA